jgi:hypothetical protein
MLRRRRTSLLSPSAFMRREAVRRGMFGGDRSWQMIGAVYFGSRFLRSVVGKQVEVVSVEELKRGQTVTVTALDPKELRRRR